MIEKVETYKVMSCLRQTSHIRARLGKRKPKGREEERNGSIEHEEVSSRVYSEEIPVKETVPI